MSERGILLLFSLGVIVASLGVAAWLITTGQAAYIDGLFLLLSCLILTLAFGLYLKYLVKSGVRADGSVPRAAKITAAVREQPAPKAPIPAEEVAGKNRIRRRGSRHLSSIILPAADSRARRCALHSETWPSNATCG